MGECDETVANQNSSPEVDLWQREFTCSWFEQQSDFAVVQSQKTYAIDVKPAKTRNPQSSVHDAAR